MTHLEYFLVAESVAVDQATNRISLFNVLEEITTSKECAIVPALVIVSAWYDDEEGDKPRAHTLTARLKIPGQDDSPIVSCEFTIHPNRRHRVLNRMSGLTLSQSGILEFEVLLDGAHQATHRVDVRVGET